MSHTMQLAGFVVALLVAVSPLAVWINNTSSIQAAMLIRMERQDRDAEIQRADQRLVTQNLIDVGKTLTRIDTQLEAIREQKPKR